MISPVSPVSRSIFRDGVVSSGERKLAEETAIAITYNRVTHAVMMATPDNLHEFAVGFSLSEGIIPGADTIEDFTVIEAEGGVELRMWIGAEHMASLEKRRRRLAGATGCGMCGLESLAEALRPIPVSPAGLRFAPEAILRAVASLGPAQSLNQVTRAVHAAGFWTEADGLVAVREDVGRHNALDKLYGAMVLSGHAAANGVVVLTSRISIELVQKASRMGAAIVIAISAPTALAVRAAEASGLTLVGVARGDGFEVFTGGWRIGA